ncbi:MAG TPA: tRNA (adenosine(37)-N6)-threonylcarbamoyltransferase complex dimerization subunit type 1 TsaB [Acidimicrobiales bacterium]|nr:tRNA (adenosine(37)-N6)-threonylcarbamoyltransferase complex dimerization subunit type 1 TsaB [Acidimicrobiales bacterium]
MLLLAIETATEAAGVALADDTGPIVEISTAVGRRHAETLVPAVESACRFANVALSEVSAVAVDIGPGLFTGLRVGVGTAKALGFALGVPVVTASSLEVLALGALSALDALRSRPTTSQIVSVVDARRGEVYWAVFEEGPDGFPRLVRPERTSPPAQLADEVAGSNALLVGNGAVRYRELLEGIFGEVAGTSLASPAPRALAAIGAWRLRHDDVHDAADVLPLYLREADVRINWEARRPQRIEPSDLEPNDLEPNDLDREPA